MSDSFTDWPSVAEIIPLLREGPLSLEGTSKRARRRTWAFPQELVTCAPVNAV
jgi:hypothetical protein